MTAQNLVIFGASGNCGQWAAKSAIAQGYNVRVLIRPGSKAEFPGGVEIMHGEVMDAQTVNRAVQGQDAVLSCLGIKRKSASNPWSPVVSPVDLAEQSAKNIVAAMKRHDVKRVVSISAAGVAESWPQINPAMRLLIKSSNVSVAYRKNRDAKWEFELVATNLLDIDSKLTNTSTTLFVSESRIFIQPRLITFRARYEL